MLNKSLRSNLAILLVFVMVFGQVVQVLAIDEASDAGNGILSPVSIENPMETQIKNDNDGATEKKDKVGEDNTATNSTLSPQDGELINEFDEGKGGVSVTEKTYEEDYGTGNIVIFSLADDESYMFEDQSSKAFTSISTRGYHSLQVRSDGAIYAWGRNNYGQLGDGTNTDRTVAVQVKDIQDVVAVAAGESHSLALRNDGKVFGWGYNWYGELGDGSTTRKNKPVQVEELSDVTAIAAGSNHSLALRSDGTVFVWGDNTYGQLGDGSTKNSSKPVQIDELTDVIGIAAGGYHSLALRSDGTVFAWGYNNYGQLGDGSTTDSSKPVQVEGLTDVIGIAAGEYHSLALRSDGTVFAWGHNSYGQLGDGSTTRSNKPVQVKGLTDVTGIAAGEFHSLALISDGTVFAWGNNDYGQLGDGSTTRSSKPVQVEGLADVIGMAAGGYHNLALKSDETVWVWGRNNYGQLGDGTKETRKTPVLSKDIHKPTKPENLSAAVEEDGIVLSWKASTDGDVVAGYEIYRDGKMIATVKDTVYKDNDVEPDKTHVYKVMAYDSSGNKSEEESVIINDNEPPSIPRNLKVVSQTVTTVSLKWDASTDNVWVEGYEIYRNGEKVGEANQTSFDDLTVPHNSTHTYTVKAYDKSKNYSNESDSISVTTGTLKSVPLAAGQDHSLQIFKDGTIYAWGRNNYGQLGDGTNTDRTVAVQVKDMQNAVAVASAGAYSLALRNDGTVWGWGYNWRGELGDGSTTHKNIPVQAKELNDIIAIAAGGNHGLALRSDGTVFAWGYNHRGQLGDGSTRDSIKPVQVEELTNVIAIAAGKSHSLALRSDGTVFAWGYNYYGQLGDGSRTDSSKPVQVKELSDVIAIAAGAYHSLALRSDGTVFAWGHNGDGQLGDGSRTDRNKPVQVKELSDVIAIAAGAYHSLALRSDGTVFAWGDNYYGQLGDGSTTDSNKPVKVKNLNDVIAVSAGDYHSLAIKTDNSLWAWGMNSYGQLGDGTKVQRNTPVLSQDTNAPTVPANLVARSTDTEVSLTWTASEDGTEIEYIVYRNGSILATVSETEYKDTDIIPGEIYVYCVRAVDAFGNISEPSNEVVNDTELPTAPTNITAVSKTVTSITLSWEASTDNVEVKGYEIYRDGELLATVDTTSYTDAGLNPGTVYEYTIRAFDTGYNYSLQSEKLSEATYKDETAPTVPQNLRLYDGSDTFFALRWNASTDDAWVEGYEIYRDGVKLGEVKGNYTYYEDKTIETGVTYVYTVRAFDSSGNVSLESEPLKVADDYGNTFNTAAVIQAGSEVSGTSIYTYDRDYFSFTAPADGLYTIICKGSFNTSYKYLYLYDENKKTIGYHSTIYNNDLKIEQRLSANKTYYIEVYFGSTGSYSLKVVLPSDTESPTASELKVVSATETTVTLGWSGSTDNVGVAGYRIYRDGEEIRDIKNSDGEMKYTDTGLMPGQTYKYVVKAYDSSQNVSEASNEVTVTTKADTEPPSVPKGLRITNKTATSITFSWEESTDNAWVTGYEIYKDGKLIDTTDKNTYTDSFKASTTSYYYTVRAYDVSGNKSDESETVLCDNTPPQTVKNIKAVSKTASTIDLIWDVPQDNAGVSQYHIYRDGKMIGTSPASSFTDTSLKPEREYTYKIRAVDIFGNVSEPGEAECRVTTEADTLPPSVPLNLGLVSNSPTSVTLAWTASTDDVLVAGYYIYRDGKLIGTTIYTNYTDTTLTETENHVYTVRAFDETGNVSEDSKAVVLDRIAPSKPQNLILVARGTNVISIAWDASTDNVGVTEYIVYRDGKEVGTTVEPRFTDTGLELNVTYSYKVLARDSSKNVSDVSESIEVTTTTDNILPSAPSGLRMEARTGSSITIVWTASSDNTGVAGYEIFRDGQKVGTSPTASYTDTELTAGKNYTYTVRAFDASNNISEESASFSAAPLNPEIVRVSPQDMDILGGAESKELRVYFTTSGKRWVEKAKFEYSADGINWVTITGNIAGPFEADSSTWYYSVLWDIRPLKTGKYNVRYSVYDAAGVASSVTVTYDIDRDVPSAPQNLKAESVNGQVELTWECPKEADVEGYRIYRSAGDSEKFLPIEEVIGRTVSAYTDISVKNEEVYYYRVTAFDRFKQESQSSNIVSVKALGGDSVSPVVYSIKPESGKAFGANANVTVEAEDNVMVSAIKLQYSLDEGNNWIDVATKLTYGTGRAEFTWDTPNINGEILVRAIAIDRAGNESDGSLTRTYTIDRQGPAKVEGVSAEEYANSVVLRWNMVPDKDFAYFEVERKNTQNGEFKSAGKVENKLGMQVTGLDYDSTYWFRVVAYDIYGNRGTYSDEIEVNISSDKVPPYISKIGPNPGCYNDVIHLYARANDNGGIKAIIFQISPDMNEWSDVTVIELDGKSKDVTVNYDMDVSELEEGNYYVRAIATDKAGNTTQNTTIVEYIVDRTAPKKPENMKVEAGYSYITLSWDIPLDDDFAYCRVYKSTSEAGPYTAIKEVYQANYNDRGVKYTDHDVMQNISYYYKVTAVDMAGNEGLPSEVVTCNLLNYEKDTENPKILAMSPAEGTMLPANPYISVLAEDNYKVAKVTLKYKKEGDSVWTVIDEKNIGKYREIVRFDWDTFSLSDGKYILQAVAIDEAGNVSDAFEVTYELNVLPPQAPVLVATPGDFKVDLSWTCGLESDIAGFVIYRSLVPGSMDDYVCINQSKEKSYVDDKVEYGKTYYYMVKAVDIRGNYSWSNEVEAAPTGVDTIAPVAVAGDEQIVILGMEVEFDASRSYDNDRIERYEWDFGNGNTANTARAAHTYKEKGKYIVTLTVYDPTGNKASSTTTVYVASNDESCGLEVKIVDEAGGNPVEGAQVLVRLADNSTKEFTSNSKGIVKMAGGEGEYKIFVYKNGYSAAYNEVLLEKGKLVQLEIPIKKAEIVTGELKVERMTLDEIVNAGIDVHDPENQWVYECNIVLGFRKVKYVVNGSGRILFGGEDSSWGHSYGDYVIYPKVVPCPNHPEVPPTVYYLIIPAKASWLKEFFEVSLVMQNTAEEGTPFEITNSTAELKVPEGLTFMPSVYSSSTKVEMDTISPGETKEAKWVLRGDIKGEYTLQAEFNGILQPFGELINAVYTTEEPVKVWGDDALVMRVKAEEYAYKDELYLVEVELENVSDTELYNVSFEFKEGVNYRLSDEHPTSQLFEVIKPGEKKTFDIWVIPNFTGKLDLSESFIVKTGGNANIKTTITYIPVRKEVIRVETQTSFVEISKEGYYIYKVIANVKTSRGSAENVKAKLELTGVYGADDIEILGTEVHDMGNLTSVSEKQVEWNLRFKPVLETANINLTVNVANDIKLYATANGSISVKKNQENGGVGFKYASGYGEEGNMKDYTAICYYDDDYFSKPSNTKSWKENYNPSLATMSLNLAMAAFPSNASDDKTCNAKALLTDLGFKGFEADYPAPSVNTIGVLAANKKVTFGNDEYTLIAVAIRSRSYTKEWASNFEIGSEGEHEGFGKAKTKVLEFLKDYIEEKNITGDIKLWITGYSRGAAVANLVAGELDKGLHSLGEAVTLHPSNIYAYCFEPPAGVLLAQTNDGSGYKNIFNIVNSNDIVTKLAPSAWGFGRYGTDLYIPSALNMSYGYENAKAKMKEKYEDIESINNIKNDDKYDIDGFAWPGVQEIFLDYAISTISKVLINRSDYVEKYQESIMNSLAKDGKGNLLELLTAIPLDKENREVGIGIINTFGKNKDRIMAGHFPELCLAWLQSMDKNYTQNAEVSLKNGMLYRIVKVNCPVDVNVYNNSGVLVASIKSDEPQSINGSTIVSAVNEDGEKIVYIPADADYSIEIIASDKGTVTYSINEFSGLIGDITRIINYYNIGVKKGDVLKAVLPAYSENDYETNAVNGSSANYTLKGADDKAIASDVELKGKDASDAWYMVNVLPNNVGYGMVAGQGIRYLGYYAKVTALAYDGYKFEGWYIGDECVSTDKDYRFCVTKDETLIAKFVPDNKEPGGSTEPGGQTEPGGTTEPGGSTQPNGPSEPSQNNGGSGSGNVPVLPPESASKSNNANISKLAFSEGKITPDFDKSKMDYELLIDEGLKEIRITVDLEDEKASMTIQNVKVDGDVKEHTLKLSDKQESIVIKVTAEDGTNKTYTVKLVRYVTETEPEIPGAHVTDIDGHWAKESIVALIRRGILAGYTDNTFRPDNKITRAEAAVLLVKLFEIKPKEDKKLMFSDEEQIPEWAYPYIAAAVEHGWIKGYTDNTFKPSNYITRQEFAAMFVKAMGYDNLEAKATGFADDSEIGSWAKGYVAKAVELSLISGYPDNTFRGNGNITRAEASAIAKKYLDIAETAKGAD